MEGKTILIAGGVLIGGVLLWKLVSRGSAGAGVRGAPPPVPSGGYTGGNYPTQPNAFQAAESIVTKYTGVPLAELGHLAESAPGWLQAVVPVVALNSWVQKTIDHPVDTLKSAGNAALKYGGEALDVAETGGKAAVHVLTLGLV